MNKDKALFLYGKIGNKRKAQYYCSLHKCYVSRPQLFAKKIKCEKCKYRKEVDKYGEIIQ